MAAKQMIYTDGIHIVGDTVKELHEFASIQGIKPCWFHNKRKHPHYDKPKRFPLDRLLENGAQLVDSKTIVRIIKTDLQGQAIRDAKRAHNP